MKFNDRKSNSLKAERFLKELLWLFNDYRDVDLNDILSNKISDLENYVPKNKNIFFLTGCLPSLFINEKYFPSNSDLYIFCKQYIGITIKRYEKKSRYDLIGQIVCEISQLNDDSKLEKLSLALKELLINMDNNNNNNINENVFLNWRLMLDEIYNVK